MPDTLSVLAVVEASVADDVAINVPTMPVPCRVVDASDDDVVAMSVPKVEVYAVRFENRPVMICANSAFHFPSRNIF